MTDIINIAYIGNGKSANRYHLPFVLQRKDKFNVKAMFSPEHHNCPWEEIDGVFYTEDLDAILNDKDINVIVICTPAQSHFDLALKVLNAGKHCLVEKPFTQTSEEAKQLLSIAKEKNLVIQSYQNRRFDSDFLTVQKVIESGKLGDLLELEMHYDYYRPYVSESSRHFKKEESYLYNHGCHTIDQVISYFGMPEDIHYDVRQLLGNGRFNDYFDIDLYYGKLKVSVKSSYFRVKDRPSFVVYGKSGSFVKDKKDRQEEHLKYFYMPTNKDFGVDTINDYGVLSYYDEAGEYHEEKVKSEKGDYGLFYDALFDTLVNGKPKLVSDEQMLKQIEILEAGVSNLF